MTEAAILDVLRQALWTALIVSTPILAVFWVTMSFSGHTLVQFYQDQIIPMVIGR